MTRVFSFFIHAVFLCELMLRGSLVWGAQAEDRFHPPPQIIGPEARTLSGPKINFRWEPVRGAVSYEFEIADINGKVVYAQSTREPKVEYNRFDRKSYRWKVRAIFQGRDPASGEPIKSTFSRPIAFAVSGSPVPANGISPSAPRGRFRRTDEFFRFKWNESTAVARTKKAQYTMYLYSHSGGSTGKLLAQEKIYAVNGTMVEHARILGEGDYSWRVAYVDDDGSMNVSKLSYFSVQAPTSEKRRSLIISGGGDFFQFGYDQVTPDFEGKFTAGSAGLHLGAKYYFADHWYVSMDARNALVTFKGVNSNYLSLLGGAGFKTDLHRKWNLKIEGFLGGSYDMLPEVRPVDESTWEAGSVTRVALTPSLRLHWTDRGGSGFYVGADLKMPLLLSNSVFSTSTSFAKSPYITYTAGLVGAWFWPWLLTAEAKTISDGFTYSAADGDTQVQYSGFAVGLSLSYQF